MKLVATSMLIGLGLASSAFAQSKFEESLCEAAKTGRVVELVYDKDVSKGCAPRIIDVHQVAIGNNGSFYMRGWQSRGCTKGRDFEAKRIFKLEKVKAVELVVGDFGEKSQSAKDEGWNGCIGSNCFIKENICE